MERLVEYLGPSVPGAKPQGGKKVKGIR